MRGRRYRGKDITKEVLSTYLMYEFIIQIS